MSNIFETVIVKNNGEILENTPEYLIFKIKNKSFKININNNMFSINDLDSNKEVVKNLPQITPSIIASLTNMIKNITD